MNKELLRAEGIVKRRGGATVLEHMELNVFEGESMALLGRNSSGKSTLASIVSGESMEDSGRVLLCDAPSDSRRRLRTVGLVRRSSSLVEGLTLAENLFAVKRNAPSQIFYRKRVMEALTDELLKSFGVDWEVRRPVSEMPISVQHVCRILKSLINGKKLVVLDEICEDYTPKELDFLYSIMKKLNARGVAVLYIAHNFDEVAARLERTVIIREGTCVKCFWGQSCDSTAVTNLMLGYKFESETHRKEDHRAGTPLSLSNVGGKRIQRGTALGIADLDGTLDEYFEKMLPQWSQQTGGSIAVVDQYSPDREWIDSMPLADNIVMPILTRISGPFGIVSGAMKRVCQRECSEKLPWCTSMEKEMTRYLTREKRLELLFYRWSLQKPALVVMNRAASGIDPVGRETIYNALEDFLHAGAAVLYLSGDLREIVQICDRALLVARGEVAGEFNCSDQNAAEVYETVFGGKR